MSTGLPTLPVFKNDWLLGASDLNRIGQAQAYVSQSITRPNVPFFYMSEDDTRYIVHRYRYLHWTTTTASGADLTVNGTVVDTAAGTSGFADLNSLGIPVGDVIAVLWTGAATTCSVLYEFPESTTSLTLPAANPTFTTGANETQLNAIVTNTQYLVDNVGNAPYIPFVSRHWNMAPTLVLDYGIIHANRWLYFYAVCGYSGTQGTDDLTIQWLIDDVEFRFFNTDGDDDDGGALFSIEFWYDLQGTDHLDISWTATGQADAGVFTVADGSTFGLSPGDEYKLTVNVAEAHLKTRMRLEMISETVGKAF